MTQEDAINMNNEQAIDILIPLRDMMRDQHGCPISDAYFALDKAIEALQQPEIIHCKNCEHNESPCTAGNACCNKLYGMTDQMGFCHYGERRTDECMDV